MAEDVAYKAFLENIIKGLVDYPNDVRVEKAVDEMGVLLILQVNKQDMGTIIGKKGNTINCIRTLVRIVGLKNNARVNIQIKDTEDSPRRGAKKENSIDKKLEDLSL
jgi:predicted RNA-binding protein YlqC (UPF0109 family)